MPVTKNSFKAALGEGRAQIGLWTALASPVTAEILGGSGYDWLVLDAEHGPNDLPLLLSQMQALAPFPVEPVVRPRIGDAALIKQLLDIGARTILVPMIETAEQATLMARAMRYPPHGMRGVGASLGRASHYGRITDYLATADAEICLLLQVESRAGVAAASAIAATDGVDGVFIGPSDLAADMGYLGQPAHPAVLAVIETTIARIRAEGKAAGILTGDLGLARHYLALGCAFVAIGSDVGLLASASRRLRADLETATPSPVSQTGKAY